MLLFIATAATMAGCGHTPIEPAFGPRDMPWSADRPLSWNDFSGPVDDGATPEEVAMTAASLRWTYEYRIERGSGSCLYWITGIRTQAVFDRGASWVKPGHRNASVLGHEQGHFDITQIYKLMLDERMDEVIGVRRTCEGDTLEQASQFAESGAAEQVQALFDAVWQQHTAVQASYDRQTHHGMVVETQALWTENIRRGLRLGHWDVPREEPI